MEFTPIESQEALDEIVNTRIEENTKSVTESVTKSVTKEVTAKFEGYVSPEDFKAKTAEYENTISDLTSKNKAFEVSNCKLKAAHEFNIPFELAERITGADEKSIKADAEKLSKYLANKQLPNFTPEKDPPKNLADSALLRTVEKLKGE